MTPDRPESPPAGGVDVRAPRWSRAYSALFAVVWLGLLGSFALDGLRERDAGALVLVPMAAFGIFLFSRVFVVRARTRGDELVVRNSWRRRVVRRQDVEDVRTGKPQSGPSTLGESVLVLVRDGSIVTLEATWRLGWTAAGRRELADGRERLLAWARGGR
ncbi:hypothetical protein GCM10009528_36390 [Kineococcus aurantiacus]